jgi:hypothetical protein
MIRGFDELSEDEGVAWAVRIRISRLGHRPTTLLEDDATRAPRAERMRMRWLAPYYAASHEELTRRLALEAHTTAASGDGRSA